MADSHYIINTKTNEYIEVLDPNWDDDWKQQYPHVRDLDYMDIDQPSIWLHNFINGIPYGYDLCCDGGIFRLFVDIDKFSDEDIKKAKADLRHKQDVVSLRVMKIKKYIPRVNNITLNKESSTMTLYLMSAEARNSYGESKIDYQDWLVTDNELDDIRDMIGSLYNLIDFDSETAPCREEFIDETFDTHVRELDLDYPPDVELIRQAIAGTLATNIQSEILKTLLEFYMSWGERACVHFAVDCPVQDANILTCTVQCHHYEWNKINNPDTMPKHHPDSILSQGMVCACGWSGIVDNCIPDVDGDGSLGCPKCEKVVKS